MINYTDKENMLKLIDIEKNSLKATLDIQKNLNKQILIFMKNFIGNMQIDLDFNPENKTFYYMNESTSALNKSNSNIEAIQKLLNRIDTIISSCDSLPPSKIQAKIKTYNNQFTSAINSIYKNTDIIEDFIHKIALLDLSEFLENEKSMIKKEGKEENSIENYAITTQELDNSFIENTLVISDIQGKIILPYQLEKVKETLLNNNDKYSSIEDVIEKLYTKPIKYYKFSAVARFKEAYKLILEKEHGSKFKAISLASELFANYNLHPAIITACQSLDELDIYLACLEDNSLEDFKFFNIKYEIAPVVATNTN